MWHVVHAQRTAHERDARQDELVVIAQAGSGGVAEPSAEVLDASPEGVNRVRLTVCSSRRQHRPHAGRSSARHTCKLRRKHAAESGRGQSPVRVLP